RRTAVSTSAATTRSRRPASAALCARAPSTPLAGEIVGGSRCARAVCTVPGSRQGSHEAPPTLPGPVRRLRRVARPARAAPPLDAPVVRDSTLSRLRGAAAGGAAGGQGADCVLP